MAKAATRKTSGMSPDEKFFYEKSGWGYTPGKETKEQGRRRGAEKLARAMQIAEDQGWEFVWEEDPEEYQMGDAEEERPAEVLMVALKDRNGQWLASLGGIGMSGNQREARDYIKVVEAELAVEAASNFGLLQQQELPFKRKR